MREERPDSLRPDSLDNIRKELREWRISTMCLHQVRAQIHVNFSSIES